MRSRSVSRRSAPSASAVEVSLSRMRSRSAHREQDRHSWVSQTAGTVKLTDCELFITVTVVSSHSALWRETCRCSSLCCECQQCLCVSKVPMRQLLECCFGILTSFL